MNPTTYRYTKKVLSLIVTLLFLSNVCVSSCVFAGTQARAEKIQYQEKQDAAYSPSQLVQRETDNNKTVESKNDMIKDGPSVGMSKITDIVESAGTNTGRSTAGSKELVNFINEELGVAGAGKTVDSIEISNSTDKEMQYFLSKIRDTSESKEPVSEEFIELVKRELENRQKESTQDAAAQSKDVDKAIDDFLKQHMGTDTNPPVRHDLPPDYVVADDRTIEAITPLVFTVARTLLDTNNDGQVNESDEGVAQLEDLFKSRDDIMAVGCSGNDGSNKGIEDPGLRDLIGKILFWAIQNSGDKSMSLYIGDGIELDYSHTVGPDGDNDRGILIKIKDWTLNASFSTPDRGVDTGTTQYVEKAFRNLENARKKLKNTANEDANAALIEEGDKSAKQEIASHKPDVQKRKETVDKKQDSSSIYSARPKPNSSEQKGFKTAAGKKALFVAKDKNAGSQDIKAKALDRREAITPKETIDHAVIVEREWDEAKGTLNKIFERVLTEEPGAVYSGGNGSINAIILLTSAVAPNNNKDNSKGSEDKKS